MLKVASSLLILLGAFAVGSAQSAPIQITSLPFTIVQPGTYHLVSPVYATAPTGASITINVNVPGKVVLDLQGHYIIPYLVKPGQSPFDCIDVLAGEDVLIENGAIADAGFGFFDGISVNPQASLDNPTALSNVKINNVLFGYCSNYGIVFNFVDSSTVSNCTFNFAQFGIEDLNSPTGNTYKNDNFEFGSGIALTIGGRAFSTINCHVTRSSD